MDFNKIQLGHRLADLASKGVFIGTSSWKYPGWRGMVYDESRYLYRGKFAKSRFEANCLAEYAEVFKTVCVDAAYYNFPTREYLEGLASQVPPNFKFGFKVTDAITIKRFPDLPRFGPRRMANENFLNVDAFVSQFLEPCEAIRSQVGILIFEFSRFHRADYQDLREFIADLDAFLSKLPKGWPYGIEMRNDIWLGPEYLDCLARHQVAHVYNSWTDMPTVSEQLALPGSRTNPALVAARFLLTPGKTYERSIQDYEPFDSLKKIDENARSAATTIIDEGARTPSRYTYVFVNNRLEGCAPRTIQALVDAKREALRPRLPTEPGSGPTQASHE
jgi:uncharacterized protein YecE (DUF72 family)